jgi:hypothetical protein
LTNENTERLKRQINEAQRSLCEGSSGQPQPSAESPTLKRDNRRHSGAQTAVAEPAVSAAKRAKTVTTYSSKKPTSSSLEREKFLATYGQDAALPDNSPSIHFSDHSGAAGSGGLPVSSLLSGFASHDPAMFKESGSTVADNESSHERMVEQVLRSKSHTVRASPGIKLVQSDDVARSSSFPWSASEPTESAKNNRTKGTQASAVETGDEAKASGHHVNDESHSTALPVIHEHDIPLPPTAVMIPPSDNAGVQKSSPTVQITSHDMAAPSLPEPLAAPVETKQKAARGRKRKVQEQSSEPLNSDDIAVGLPKERYKPRPSRRRATEVTEEPIDYSVVPGKAAKSKRSKTIGGGLDAPEEQLPVKGKLSLPSSSRKTKSATVIDVPDAEPTTFDKTSRDQAAQPVSTIPQTSSPVVELPGVEKPQPSQETPKKEAAAIVKEVRKDEDFAFAKPAPKSRPASKSIRSSTTIFEDHVGLTGKSRSPSLSQQQAMRQSVLLDVKNEATPVKPRRGGKHVVPDDDDDEDEKNEATHEATPAKPRRGGKHVVPEDDDDEDELALEPAHEEQPPVEVPKKRGRGRPTKAAAAKASKKTAAKSAKPAVHDSESEDDEIALMPPPKKRRGRPPKFAAAVEDADNSKDAEASVIEPEEDDAPAKQPVDKSAKESTPAKQIATEIPTPSPDSQPPAPAEKTAAPKKPAKVSPPAHSPIKSSSPAPYRVGLSKKHRIPSLLRVMRPPPPKRG